MNKLKLKEAAADFFVAYPGGFAHPDMMKIAEKHKPEKMTALAQQFFNPDAFADYGQVVENMVKMVSRSSMISIFEKPRFRDYCKSLDADSARKLSDGLYLFLHGDEEKGFDQLVSVLQQGKIAKWSIITIFPTYYRPQKEVFVKPTTVKAVIETFEIQEVKYHPTPTYDFYKKYRDVINKMKKEVPPSLSPSNAAFSGFLMMSMGV
ncbi:MAG: hypothetical protein CVU05_09710 [Bacteroidetes bacterium HGW-Bacteroidetes-21]|jgi:hypothetical protein|nr:MAG: hypothetical protein CVU05_09710 [Bacteroidetes bacterium HGW-Bacteroidetes-21]